MSGQFHALISLTYPRKDSPATAGQTTGRLSEPSSSGKENIFFASVTNPTSWHFHWKIPVIRHSHSLDIASYAKVVKTLWLRQTSTLLMLKSTVFWVATLCNSEEHITSETSGPLKHTEVFTPHSNRRDRIKSQYSVIAIYENLKYDIKIFLKTPLYMHSLK